MTFMPLTSSASANLAELTPRSAHCSSFTSAATGVWLASRQAAGRQRAAHQCGDAAHAQNCQHGHEARGPLDHEGQYCDPAPLVRHNAR